MSIGHLAPRLAAIFLSLMVLLAGHGPASAATIEKVQNTGLAGEAYARLRGLTYAQCEERCLKDPQCVALEFFRGGETLRRSAICRLFANSAGERVASNTDVGYKRPGTAETSRKRATRSIEPEAPRTAERPPAASRGLAPTTSPPATTTPATQPPPPQPVAEASRSATRGLTADRPAPAAPAPGSSARTGATRASPDYHIVPVFYGTNRNRQEGARRVTYLNDRTRRLELGQALVSVPLNHQVPNIERPRAWNVPFWGRVQLETEDPKKHFTIREIRTLTKQELIDEVKKRLGGSQTFKGQSLVFIHGYNVGFDDAVFRTAQISFDLQFDGAAYTFSWPSGGGLASYIYDRDSAQGAEPYLYEFLQMVQAETGTTGINIIAHSMGNQMLLQVLRSLKNRQPGVAIVNQIVLAAPDVDRDAFEGLAREITGIARGITLYAASNDRALDASRLVAGNKPRAGDVPTEGPVIIPGIDTIDITSLSTSYLSLYHSGYAERTELLSDISRLFRTGLRPPEARIAAFKPVTIQSGTFWRYTKP